MNDREVSNLVFVVARRASHDLGAVMGPQARADVATRQGQAAFFVRLDLDIPVRPIELRVSGLDGEDDVMFQTIKGVYDALSLAAVG